MPRIEVMRGDSGTELVYGGLLEGWGAYHVFVGAPEEYWLSDGVVLGRYH